MGFASLYPSYDYSGFTPVSRMIARYFALSCFVNAANASVDIGRTSAPASSSFCFISESARTALIYLFSRAITSGGVPRGAK